MTALNKMTTKISIFDSPYFLFEIKTYLFVFVFKITQNKNPKNGCIKFNTAITMFPSIFFFEHLEKILALGNKNKDFPYLLYLIFFAIIFQQWKTKNKPSALPESLKSIKFQPKSPMVNPYLFRGSHQTHQKDHRRLQNFRALPLVWQPNLLRTLQSL